MKKHLLLILALAICVHAYPQTSVKDAAALSDYNTYTPEDGSGQEACGYWKYTSQEDELVKIIMTANGTASFFELDEADEQKKIYAASTFDESYIYTYYVPVLKNHTVYFKVTAYDTGTASFYAEMEKNRNIGKTSSKDSPLPITDGEPLLLGDMYQNDWGERAYYVTYTATETGKLNIRSNQSITSASVNGTVINFAYSDNSYTSGFNVDAGEKYEIELKSYSNLMLTAELSHPAPGSFDMPFTLEEGTNSVPAADGEYWYTFNLTETLGYARISSSNTLPEGEVKIYQSESDARYDSPKATSQTGSYNARFEMICYNPSKWYFKVDKKHGTPEDDAFEFCIEGYQDGDKENQPVMITETPAEFTLDAKVSKYYAIEIPANSMKTLSVKALTQISSASFTSVMIYEQGNSGEAVSGTESVRKNIITKEKAVRYLILWNSYENEPINFTVTLTDIPEGEIIENPIIITEKGKITASGTGTRYYRYTATKDCKLTVRVSSEGMSVEFPEETGYREIMTEGSCYSIEAESSKAYLISISGIKDGDSFIIEENEFMPGEVRSYPVTAENGTYTFGKEKADKWIAYTASKDGIMDIAADIPYSENTAEYVEYGKTRDTRLSRMLESKYIDGQTVNKYQTSLKVNAGDSYIVHTVFENTHEGCKVTFTERSPLTGEDATNPYILEKDATLHIEQVAGSKPTWCMATLTEGTATLTYNSYWHATLYKGLENAKAGTNGTDIQGEYDYFNASYTYDIEADEGETDYYIAITDCYTGMSLTLTGDNIVERGKTIDKPVVIAQPCEITPSGTGTRYYRYTATKDCWLTVNVSNDKMSVKFMRYADTEYENHDTETDGCKYTIKADGNTTYIIKVDGIEKGHTFTVEENDFEPGELRDNPVSVENGIYTFTGKEADLWLSYTVKEDGYMDILADIPYSEDESEYVEYGKCEDEDLVPMKEQAGGDNGIITYIYKTSLKVCAGETYIVHAVFGKSLETLKGCKVFFTERAPMTGEDTSAPYILENSKPLTVTLSKPGQKIWCKATMTKGQHTLSFSSDDANAVIYKNKEDADAETNGEEITTTPDGKDGNYSYSLSVGDGEEGDWYLSISPTATAITVTLTNITSGISEAHSEYRQGLVCKGNGILHIYGAEGIVRIFTASGTLVSEINAQEHTVVKLPEGIYIIHTNGRSYKAIVK